MVKCLFLNEQLIFFMSYSILLFRKKAAWFIFIFLLCKNTQAQFPLWKNYTNGIEVQAIAAEGNFIWVGTSGGLVRIDKVTGSAIIYTKENSGIPCVNVRAIVIDSIGNKWIGTWYGGLAKFDGSTWTVFNTSNSPITCNDITDLCISRNGDLWIGQWNGLDRLSGSTWTRFDDTNSPITYIAGSVKSIACDAAGNLFAGISNDGLAKYDGTGWTVFNRFNSGIQNDMIFDLAVDTNNALWAAAPVCNGTGGLIRLVDTTFTVFIPGTMVENLQIDQQNNIWFTGFNKLTKFDGTTFTYFNSSNSQVNYTSPYNCLLTETGNIWFGTFPYKGLNRFDGTYQCSNYGLSFSGIPFNHINSIAVDNQERAWFTFTTQDCWACDQYKGLEMRDQNGFTNFSTSNSGIPTDSVTTVAIDPQNNIWIGTYSSGVIKYDGTSFQLFDSLTYGLPSNIVTERDAFAFDSFGNVWVAFSPAHDTAWNPIGGGIAKYDGNSWTTIVPTINIPYNVIYSIAVDHNGVLWVACYGKILKYDGVNWDEYTSTNSILTDNYFSCMTVDKNNDVWIGTNSYPTHGNLIRISNSVLSVYSDLNCDIPASYINSLSVDAENNLWIGLYDLENPEINGLTRLSGSTFTNYDIYNSGLSTFYVNDVYAFKKDIYLATDQGLLMLSDTSAESTTLVENEYNNSNVTIFPNPSIGYSIFDIKSKEKVLYIEILNCMGQIIFKESNFEVVNGNATLKLDTRNYIPGIYYYKLKTSTSVSAGRIAVSSQ